MSETTPPVAPPAPPDPAATVTPPPAPPTPDVEPDVDVESADDADEQVQDAAAPARELHGNADY